MMQFDNLIRSVFLELLSSLEVSFAAEVKNFDEKKMKADVKPLLKFSGVVLPEIKNVPVEILGGSGYFIRPVFKKGDIVRLSVSGSAIKRAIEEKRHVEMKSIEKFLIGNCTVSSGLVQTPPSIFSSKSGLLIGTDNSYIHITNSGIEIFGNVTVTGTVDATDVSAGMISLLTHKHISGNVGSPTSPPVP